jgi:Protein of unknown function (DUF2971).
MSGTSMQEKAESCFQQFETFNGSKYVLVSNKLEEVLKQEKGEESSMKGLVQRYLPIDRFLDSTLHHYFYMAAPKTWDDPFETKYLDTLNGELQNLMKPEDFDEIKEMSIFCVCMTYNNSDNEEASWKAYGENKERIIRVSYDFNKLCSILDEAQEEDFYIGKVNYMSRKCILEPHNVFKDIPEPEPSNKDMFVNNFCFKQDAYQYEKELRFCKILKGEQNNNEDCYRIEGIDLMPAITKITLPPINFKKMSHAEEMEKKIKQYINFLLLKALCPNVPIHISNLYDKSQVEMTSEI